MTVEKFIRQSLDKISNLYPEYELLYQYKNNSDTHFIKVLADNILKDKNFSDLYFEIMDNFDDTGIESELCILDNDALIELDQPETVVGAKALTMNYENFFEIQESIDISTVNENTGLLNGVMLSPQDNLKITFSGDVFKGSPFIDLTNDERSFAMAA